MNSERPKVLLVGGSLNQTTQMHQISQHLRDYECWFTPCYSDGVLRWLQDSGLFEFVFKRTILGGAFRETTLQYFKDHKLPVDIEGKKNRYDLGIICTDLVVPKNLTTQKLVLVQEGMTDHENLATYLCKWLGLPNWLGGTALTGLSKAYDRFCVASQGYLDFFANKGAPRERMVVTGIPNFDNCRQYENNTFPHRDYVLVATSDMRETLKYENRKAFIRNCVKIADGRPLVFKLHPNERVERSTREIKAIAPDALVFSQGNTSEMIANSQALITQYSSVVYTGIALGKEVHSFFDVPLLKRLAPIQNDGKSAENIADTCRDLLATS